MADSPSDEPVDIDAIMEEIRRKVREEFHGPRDEATLRDDLEFVVDRCRLDPDQLFDSPQPPRGKLAGWASQAAIHEIRRLLDPLLEKQTAWNQKVASILQSQAAEIERLQALLAGRAADFGPDDAPLEPPASDSPASP